MIICPKCGTTNEDGAEFCRACGTPLTAAEMPAKQTLPIKYPWLLKLYGLIFVVICVAICGGFVAKGVSAARANRSKPAADSKSSAPAETGASSRAETSRAATTSKAATDANTRWTRDAFVLSYNARVPSILDNDTFILTKTNEKETAQGHSTSYTCMNGKVAVTLLEDSSSALSVVTFNVPLSYSAAKAQNGIGGGNVLLDWILTPATVIENLTSFDELDRFRTTFENFDTSGFQIHTTHADYTVLFYDDLGMTISSIKLKS